MNFGIEQIAMIASVIIPALILIFFINWRYFNEWVAVFLYKSLLDVTLDNVAVHKHMLAYPDRILPQYFEMPVLSIYGRSRCFAFGSTISQENEEWRRSYFIRPYSRRG